MINTISNAAPLNVDRRTQDLSQGVIPIDPTPIPQHTPIFYIQAERGPTGNQFLPLSSLSTVYGKETFKITGKFTNHATVALTKVIAEGNGVVINRVSKGDISNFTLYLDVLAIDIPLHERNSDGSYKKDVNQLLIPTGDTVPGFQCRWLMGSTTGLQPDTVGAHLGSNSVTNGNMVDPNDPTNISTLYPIIDMAVSSQGKYGDNVGIRLYASNQPQFDIDRREMIENSVFPYFLSIVEKPTATSSVILQEDLTGATVSKVSFSRNAIDSLSNASYHFTDVLKDRYSNTTNGALPIKFSEFDKHVHVYQRNIDGILAQFAQTEAEYVEASGVISGLPVATILDPEQMDAGHLFNFVNGTDVDGIPYYTFAIDDDAFSTNVVKLGPLSNLFAKNGQDKIQDAFGYEEQVRQEVAQYAVSTAPVQDYARNPERILWDSGFSLDLKLDLSDFISQRGNTFLALSTFSDTLPVRGATEFTIDDLTNDIKEGSDRALTEAEEIATSIALLASIRLLPESDYYSTATMRGMVIGTSGKYINSQWFNRVPLLVDTMVKASRYMGAGTGRWVPGQSFSRAPRNIIDTVHEISIPWQPAERRVTTWDVGLNMPLTYGDRQLILPSLQTVYNDDTSVLNDMLTVLAICEINTVARAAHREFTNTDDLTDDEMMEEVRLFMERKLSGKFDDRYNITHDPFISDADAQRRFSWTLVSQIRASKAKTAMTANIQAFNKEG